MVRFSTELRASLATLLIAATGAAGEHPDRFVTTPGSHSLAGGKVTVEVTEAADGFRWKVSMPLKGGGQTAVRRAEPPSGKGWFAYADSADAVWVYDGRGQLSLIESAEGETGGQRVPTLEQTDATLPGGWSPLLRKRPPQELIDRLPAELRPRKEAR